MKKYTDVDIVAELQKLVDSHVDSYKEDFDIDKRIIRRAAESPNPENKTLMWFCRPHGTHCLNENQVFIQGTRDHNTFRFYAEQTYDECVARVIIPKTVKHGKVFGDVFEINYREQAANVAQNSVAPDHDRLTFADGYVLDAPCRSSFDAAMALVGEHGGVKTHQTLPKDADALAEVLSKQKTRRDRLPDAGRTETLSPLPVAELRKYEAVKRRIRTRWFALPRTAILSFTARMQRKPRPCSARSSLRRRYAASLLFRSLASVKAHG